MRYRRVHRTDLDVSAISLGCAEFGGSVAEADAFYLLDRYVGDGANFIDTASFYGRWLGSRGRYSEAVIGRWMGTCGQRRSATTDAATGR